MSAGGLGVVAGEQLLGNWAIGINARNLCRGKYCLYPPMAICDFGLGWEFAIRKARIEDMRAPGSELEEGTDAGVSNCNCNRDQAYFEKLANLGAD